MTDLEKMLSELQTELTKSLLEKCKTKTISPTEMNVARQLLKDNNIDCTPRGNEGMGALQKAVLESMLPVLPPDLDAPRSN